MKKDNKHRNSSLSEVEQEELLFRKTVLKHPTVIEINYEKDANKLEYINNEEGC